MLVAKFSRAYPLPGAPNRRPGSRATRPRARNRSRATWAGRHGDRHGHAGLLVPGLLISAAGMIILIWVAAPASLIAGMCLFGIGFGITQNVTFSLMIDRAPVAGYGTASALWNLAYDAGYGAGPAVFGVFVVYTGYPAAFAVTGMLVLAALVPALRDRTAPAPQGFPVGGSTSS